MGKTILIKIGGNALGEADTTIADLVWLQKQGHLPIVVHGGGSVVTKWLERVQVPTHFVDGLRVTDEDAIDVVVAVLAGLVNKRLVSSINSCGGRAIGLSGADGPIAYARVKNEALGLVGELEHIESRPLRQLMESGFIPVVSPIGCLGNAEGPSSTLLNINADTMAAGIGAALGAQQFVFLTDVPGVLNSSGSVIEALTPRETQTLIQTGVIHGGMVPKVEACLNALGGVDEALILDGRKPDVLRQALTGSSVQGTRIS